MRTDFVGPSRCWDSWTRLPKGGLRAEQTARSLAEVAVAAYFAKEPQTVGVRAMADGPLWRFFWGVTDRLDYLMTLIGLRVLDAAAGPEPETPVDQDRKGDRERIERRSPRSSPEGPGGFLR